MQLGVDFSFNSHNIRAQPQSRSFHQDYVEGGKRSEAHCDGKRGGSEMLICTYLNASREYLNMPLVQIFDDFHHT